MEKLTGIGKVLPNVVNGSSKSVTKDSKAALPNGHSIEYLHGIVTYLEAFFGFRISDLEVEKVWIPKLAQYQRWRLEKVFDYSIGGDGSGRTLAHVCRYLEGIMPEPLREDPRADLGYKRLEFKPNEDLRRRVLEFSKKMFSDALLPEEKDEIEVAFMESMRADYPHLDWHCTRPNNKAR